MVRWRVTASQEEQLWGARDGLAWSIRMIRCRTSTAISPTKQRTNSQRADDRARAYSGSRLCGSYPSPLGTGGALSISVGKLGDALNSWCPRVSCSSGAGWGAATHLAKQPQPTCDELGTPKPACKNLTESLHECHHSGLLWVCLQTLE